MRKPCQFTIWTKYSLCYCFLAGRRTHDLPHTPGIIVVWAFHSPNHSANEGVYWQGVIVVRESHFPNHSANEGVYWQGIIVVRAFHSPNHSANEGVYWQGVIVVRAFHFPNHSANEGVYWQGVIMVRASHFPKHSANEGVYWQGVIVVRESHFPSHSAMCRALHYCYEAHVLVDLNLILFLSLMKIGIIIHIYIYWSQQQICFFMCNKYRKLHIFVTNIPILYLNQVVIVVLNFADYIILRWNLYFKTFVFGELVVHVWYDWLCDMLL